MGGIADNTFYWGANERYDPITDSWSFEATMLERMIVHGVVTVGDLIYAIGEGVYAFRANEPYRFYVHYKD